MMHYRPELPGPKPAALRILSKEEKIHPYPELFARDWQITSAEVLLFFAHSESAKESIKLLVRTERTEVRALLIESCKNPDLLEELLEESSEKGNMEIFLRDVLARELRKGIRRVKT
jgi:hypothetical protein